jgi:long-chain acyl-CoA synthetase
VQATLPGTSPRALDALIASASGRSVESTALSELAPRAQDPAVILYTSGTTGYPKGVVLSQAALLRNGQLMAQRVGLAATIQLAVLPLYHAHALGFGLISALCTGGTLVFTDGLDVLQWARLVAAERIEVASVVPHMLPMLRQAGLRAERVPTLRRLLVSSAPLSLEVARAFEDTTGVSLLQGWGLSEVTNFATCLPGDLPEDERRALLFGGLAGPWTCAGAPLAGVTVEVRGADGARLGEADEGELWIRSPCRMVGYHGDPAATAELCRDEWLGSGDLGFWIARGDRQYFFITGRQKELIVRGADKYAPLAIERKLLAHAAAARGRLAVLGMKHRLYGEEVAAYLHVDPDSDLVPALRDAIAMLPLAERPKVLVCGDAPIPQTHTGKVQRRRLVELFHAYSDHRGALKIEAQRGVAELLTTASKSANPTVQQGDSSE